MSFRRLSWSLVLAILCLSAAGGAHAQPAIIGVSVPANGVYSAPQDLEFRVVFDDVVTVDTTGGTPSIALVLNTGGTVQASYVSDSGSPALVFRYRIKATDQDPDGVTVGPAIQPNGGTITGPSGALAATGLNSVGSTSGVLIANAAPAAVPTLTEWAMIFLAGLLGLFGASRLGLLPAARKS